MNLKDISRKYNTDKESEHEYLETYEKHFSNITNREDVKKVVEIGIHYGDSLLMWSEYFPNAQIIGADINDYEAAGYKISLDGKTLIDRSDVLLNHPRIKTYILDQTNEKSIKDFKFNINKDVDILIDDGGHSMEMHQKTLKYLLECVKKDGLYIIEDLHSCNYKHTDKELYGFKLIQEGDTLTTDLLEDLRENHGLYPFTNYINEGEMTHIKSQIQNIHLDSCKLSEIAFIYKK